MDQGRQRRWRSSTQGAQIAWSSSALKHRSTTTDTGLAGARRGELWFSRRSLDLFSGSESHRAGVWRGIPPSPCQPHSQRAGLDTPEANPTGQTAQGSGDPTLAGRALARAEKKAEEEGRTIVFIDESGFYLLPVVVRTYALRGCMPILNEYLSYVHLSTIGAITPQGKLFLKSYEHPITNREVAACLHQLQRLIPGQLLVIWDGSPTHRSKVIKAYLSAGLQSGSSWSNFPVMRRN